MTFDSTAAQRGARALKEARLARARGDLPPLPTKGQLRSAIAGKCAECMGGGHPIADIRACTSGPTSRAPCPLWKFRPYQQ